MKLFRDSFTTRISYGYVCVAVVLIAIIFMTFLKVDKVGHISDQILEVREPTVQYSLQMHDGINMSIAALRSWMLLKEDRFIEQRNQAWQQIEGAKGELAALSNRWTKTENKVRLESLRSELGRFYDIQTEIRDLVLKGSEDEASKVLRNKVVPQGEKIKLVLDELMASQRDLRGVEQAQRTNEVRELVILLWSLLGLGLVLGIFFASFTVRSIIRPMKGALEIVNQVADGDLNVKVDLKGPVEVEELSSAMARMQRNLRLAQEEVTEKLDVIQALREGQLALHDKVRGEIPLRELARRVVGHIIPYTHAQMGAFYVVEDDEVRRISGYAYGHVREVEGSFRIGQGLIGQVALDGRSISLKKLPEDYIKIKSDSGEALPTAVEVLPIQVAGKTIAVLEIASVGELDERTLQFLNDVSEPLGITVNAAMAREREKALLEETKSQAQELQSQQNELESFNAELEQKTEELETQQEELRQTNEELEQQRSILEVQKKKLEDANKELERSKREIEIKADQLGLAGKYKSEFLANMSHELRTPLNSILILSKLLADNEEGTLSKDQVEEAATIYSSGADLLNLINDILDLSKVEAGKLDLNPEDVKLEEVKTRLERGFKAILAKKEVGFEVEITPDCPPSIFTDGLRFEQILKNFLSNACKYTTHGKVTVTFRRPAKEEIHSLNLDAVKSVAVTVKDTGIGIPKSKQAEVFEAFRQVDGTISRKYGGTGLGLSIARGLTHLLQGEIGLQSEEGKGTAITVIVPERLVTGDPSSVKAETYTQAMASSSGGRVSEVKVEPSASEKKSWIHRRVLVIEDNDVEREAVTKLISGPDTEVFGASSGEDGLVLVMSHEYDCVVLDLKLPDMSGFDVLTKLNEIDADHVPPVIVYTGKELTRQENEKLEELSGSVIIKGVKSPERLLEAVTQALRRNGGKREPRIPLAESDRVLHREEVFKGKKVLVVDDDMRNVFALRQILGKKGFNILVGKTGKEALDLLNGNPDTDVVLMDIMMPEMDGFEATRAIRQQERFKKLPVIALTAKAMRGDREKCLEAGASDYLAKPINTDNLISLLRVWVSA